MWLLHSRLYNGEINVENIVVRVKAMYSLLRNKPSPTTQEVDEALQGNLCRYIIHSNK